MEALYSKLYDKYTKLKTRKDNAMEELNRDQEMKFMKYMSAADDLIEHLRSEKDTLRAEVSELRSEVASIRYAKDEQYIEYQKRLLEENQKYIELSEEIERLRSKEFHSSSRDDRSDNGQLNMSGASPIALDETNRSTTRKRSRDFRHDNEVLVTPCASDLHEHAPIGESVINLSKQPISNCGTLTNDQPKCCRGRVGSSEGVTDSPSCIFQELAECLVDLKFSIASQTDEIFISAVHESSDMGLTPDAIMAQKKVEAERREAELKASHERALACGDPESLPLVGVLEDPSKVAVVPPPVAPKAKSKQPIPDVPRPKRQRLGPSLGQAVPSSTSVEITLASTPDDTPAVDAYDNDYILSHLCKSANSFPPSFVGYGRRLMERTVPAESVETLVSLKEFQLNDLCALALSELGICLAAYSAKLGQAAESVSALERDLAGVRGECSSSAEKITSLEGELSTKKGEISNLLVEKTTWLGREKVLQGRADERDELKRVVADLEAKLEGLSNENVRLQAELASKLDSEEVLDKYRCSRAYEDEVLDYMERSRIQTFRAAVAVGVPLPEVVKLAGLASYGPECRGVSSLVPFDECELSEIKETDLSAQAPEWLPAPAEAGNLFAQMVPKQIWFKESYLPYAALGTASSSSQTRL